MEKTFKKLVLEAMISRKIKEFEMLKSSQRTKLEAATDEGTGENDLAESPKEQMMQEIDLKSGTLDQLSQEIVRLEAIDPGEDHGTVSLGALVKTDRGHFLIGAAHPTVEIQAEKVTGLSTEAPLYLKMEGLKKGDEFHFGDTNYIIHHIF